MKKWIALLLACAMALSLCACGKDDTKDPTDAPTATDGENNNNGNNNNGNNNNDNNETTGFDLLKNVTVRYGDGEDSESIEMKIQYDEDFNIVGCKAYKDGKLYSEITCDKVTSKTLTQVDYDEDGGIAHCYAYTYDENGNELTTVCTDGDGNVQYSSTNTYTSAGLLETSTTNWGDGSSWYTYTYDDQGNKLSERSGSGEEIWADVTYNNIYEAGKLVEVQANQDGRLRWSERYDADGNLIAEYSFDDDGEAFSYTVYTYENGKLKLRVIYNEEDESFREEYTYNADGQLTEVRSFDEGELHGSEAYTYENGSLVNVKLYDHEELEGEYTLSYEKADVSDAQAEKLTALYTLLMEF